MIHIRLVPHSSKEFPRQADELAEFLVGDLRGAKAGRYDVARTHFWRNVPEDTTCMFQIASVAVGEGVVRLAVQRYEGTGMSPVTNKPYEGTVTFDPASIRLYHPQGVIR